MATENKKSKKAKKEKPPKYLKTLMNTEIVNYQTYYLSPVETALYFLLAFAAGGIVGYVFFGNLALDEEGRATVITLVLNLVIVCAAGGLAGWFFLPMRAEQLKEKRRKQLRMQFRDLLEALVTSLNSGKNVTIAFRDAENDLKLQYSDEAYIIQEIQVINAGIDHNMSAEQLLLDFGGRSGIRDIVDFAATFETCYRKGSNIKIVMMKTYDLISSKMQMEEEIKTKISAAANEQYIMLVMPVVITAVVKLMSPEMAANYASPSGIVVTVISIAIFIGAYLLGVRISKIEV